MKFHRSTLGPGTLICTSVFFSACHHTVLAAIVKVRMGSPKMARNEQVCVHQKVIHEVNFPKCV